MRFSLFNIFIFIVCVLTKQRVDEYFVPAYLSHFYCEFLAPDPFRSANTVPFWMYHAMQSSGFHSNGKSWRNWSLVPVIQIHSEFCLFLKSFEFNCRWFLQLCNDWHPNRDPFVGRGPASRCTASCLWWKCMPNWEWCQPIGRYRWQIWPPLGMWPSKRRRPGGWVSRNSWNGWLASTYPSAQQR